MTNSSIRVVEGSPAIFTQGTTETPVYVFHFDKMLAAIGTPGEPLECRLYDLSTGSDVSVTNLTGVPSISGYAVTTPIVHDLVKDKKYRLVAGATVDGQLFTAYKDILGEL